MSTPASDDDRPVSPHPNFVTADGLILIELELARAQERLDAVQYTGALAAIVHADRDVRYWAARRATAQVVDPPQDADQVRFGSTVTLTDAAGERLTWRIVGEDEADVVQDALAYVSPLAQALVGRKIGETVEAGGESLSIAAIA